MLLAAQNINRTQTHYELYFCVNNHRENANFRTCIIPNLVLGMLGTKCVPQFDSENSMSKLQKTHSVSK